MKKHQQETAPPTPLQVILWAYFEVRSLHHLHYIKMAAVIGNDILDIGTRKARRQRGDLLAPAVTLGAPGQFDLPNVPDVSTAVSIIPKIRDTGWPRIGYF